ncbi:MAG TPA: hypothetical protein VGO96_17010 [Pyrinomonadaceae bacterium]|jgi:hypothetical protein|nr:hypothetical protein [Pyrinomonadaceae bacterium]
MKNSLRRLTNLVLAAAIFALTLPVAPVSVAAQDKGKDKSDKKLESFKGDSAKQHIRALRARNKSLNRAMKDMEKLGKQVDWEQSAVIFTIDPAISQKDRDARAKIQNVSFGAQDSYMSNADGEMAFITSAGSGSYWDGTVYVTEYATGTTDVYNSVVDSGGTIDFTESAYEIDEVYYPPGGGEPIREGGGDGGCGGTGIDPRRLCYDQPLMTDNKGSGNEAVFQKASYNRVFAYGFFSWLSKFFKCLGRATSYFAERCVAPSPNFRNNLICAVTAAFQAAGCCAANAKRSRGPLNTNNTGPGGGYCYR